MSTLARTAPPPARQSRPGLAPGGAGHVGASTAGGLGLGRAWRAPPPPSFLQCGLPEVQPSCRPHALARMAASAAARRRRHTSCKPIETHRNMVEHGDHYCGLHPLKCVEARGQAAALWVAEDKCTLLESKPARRRGAGSGGGPPHGLPFSSQFTQLDIQHSDLRLCRPQQCVCVRSGSRAVRT